MGLVDKYYESFSGTDTMAFIVVPGAAPILLGSLTTISYSMFRVKKPINLLSKVNVAGFTRGPRTLAGTMIFTILNQHWVKELLQEVPWLQENYGEMKADELPIFDIIIIGGNEYGSQICGYIYGVDLTDEGQIQSVEDMYMENTYSFIARDIDLLRDVDGKSMNLNEEFVDKAEDIWTYINGNNEERSSNAAIVLLNDYYPELEYRDQIKKFQESKGLVQTGFMDTCTYNLLMGSNIESIFVENKEGMKVYEDPELTKEVRLIKYGDEITILKSFSNYALTEYGYVKNIENNFSISVKHKGFATYDNILEGIISVTCNAGDSLTYITYYVDANSKNKTLNFNHRCSVDSSSFLDIIEEGLEYLEIIKRTDQDIEKYRVEVII